MAEPAARRVEALDGRGWSAGGLSLVPVPAASRHVLRLRAEAIHAASVAIGIRLPEAPCTSVRLDRRAALWLGPDEWLLLDEDCAALPPKLEGAHSFVDVSHRNCGYELNGPQAWEVLEHGCALDLHLSAFPVGKCTRTMLGKAEIVLWRIRTDGFRIELWRSYADYVTAFLTRSARDHLNSTDPIRPESFPIT